MKKITSNLSNPIVNIGIALTLVGVPLGMYFNYLLPVVKWSPIFMFASFLAIISFKNLLLSRFPSFNKKFVVIGAFQLLMLLYGGFSDTLTTQYLSFHLYIIALLVAFSTNEIHLSYKNVIITTFFISGICSILGAFFTWKGLITGDEVWLLKQENDEYALESFTVAAGAITNFICALCFQTKTLRMKYLVWFFVALDVYIIFMSGKRTPVFVSLIILLIYFYKNGTISTKLLIRYLKIIFLLFLLMLFLYIYNESFQIKVDNFFYNFYNGVLNILGNTKVKDSTGSAIARYNFREWTFNYIENDFSFFNYILGAGYMTRWIDSPLLQSYLDMGIIGLVMYISLIIVFPFKSFFKVVNILGLFAVLLTVYNIMASISSGNPYAYIKHVPIVFLAFIMNLKNNRIVKRNNYLKV